MHLRQRPVACLPQAAPLEPLGQGAFDARTLAIPPRELVGGLALARCLHGLMFLLWA